MIPSQICNMAYCVRINLQFSSCPLNLSGSVLAEASETLYVLEGEASLEPYTEGSE